MNEREALQDFMAWIKQQPIWGEMVEDEKKALYKLVSDERRARSREMAGRCIRAFDRYAPGRYKKTTYFEITES